MRVNGGVSDNEILFYIVLIVAAGLLQIVMTKLVAPANSVDVQR
jgi:hypothetical protein